MVPGLPRGHAVPEGDVVQGDVRVHVGTETANPFLAEGEETERGSFGAVREDAKVLHGGSVPRIRSRVAGGRSAGDRAGHPVPRTPSARRCEQRAGQITAAGPAPGEEPTGQPSSGDYGWQNRGSFTHEPHATHRHWPASTQRTPIAPARVARAPACPAHRVGADDDHVSPDSSRRVAAWPRRRHPHPPDRRTTRNAPSSARTAPTA